LTYEPGVASIKERVPPVPVVATLKLTTGSIESLANAMPVEGTLPTGEAMTSGVDQPPAPRRASRTWLLEHGV
jgi:hypothetical protein